MQQAAYYVDTQILNSAHVGDVPQRRERLYIVCIKIGSRSNPVRLTWPCATPTPPLSSIYDNKATPLKSYANYPFPPSALGKRHVAKALLKVLEKSKNTGQPVTSFDVVVDIGSSSLNMAEGVTPTLTKSRASSGMFWSLNLGRALSLSEMIRLQGFNPSKLLLNISNSQVGARLGNAFTCTVFQKVLACAIEAAGG